MRTSGVPQLQVIRMERLYGYNGTFVTIGWCIDMIFVDQSDDSFVVSEFKYLFAVFIYDFSVLSCDLIFVNDCEFSNLLFHYLAHAIVI